MKVPAKRLAGYNVSRVDKMGSLTEFFEAQRTYQPSEKAVRKRASWEARLAKPRVKGRSIPKDALVQYDPRLQMKFAKSIAEACPLIGKPFNDTLGKVAIRAFREWPVDSGLSKSLLALDYKYEDDEMRGIVKCTAPYAYMIRETKEKAKTATAGAKRRGSSKNVRGKKSKGDPDVSRWLAIGNNPARGRSKNIWRAATFVASRSQVPTTYAGVQVAYKSIKNSPNKIQAFATAFKLVESGADPRSAYSEAMRAIKKTTKKRRPRGKNVVNELIFKPGKIAANKLEKEIALAIRRSFGL